MTRIDLDSDLLRCFVAVADSRGFTAASERIGLTQSGISVRIRNLERRLGRRLFDRTSRSVSLTEEGELLLSYARRIVDLNDEAIGRLTSDLTEGRLRLGLADYVAPRLVPSLLGRFSRLHPGVTMEMRTGLSMDLLPHYERGELDVVIAGRGKVFKDGRPLYRDPLVWVAAPGFQLRLDRPIPLATLPSHCTHRGISLQALDHAGLAWEIAYISSSTAGLHAAVLGGLGIAMIPKSSVTPELRCLGPEQGLPPLPDFEIAIFAREETPAPACRAFVAFVSEQLRPS
jgi:DNA-binding transcriptional LysR family regulator